MARPAVHLFQGKAYSSRQLYDHPDRTVDVAFPIFRKRLGRIKDQAMINRENVTDEMILGVMQGRKGSDEHPSGSDLSFTVRLDKRMNELANAFYQPGPAKPSEEDEDVPIETAPKELSAEEALTMPLNDLIQRRLNELDLKTSEEPDPNPPMPWPIETSGGPIRLDMPQTFKWVAPVNKFCFVMNGLPAMYGLLFLKRLASLLQFVTNAANPSADLPGPKINVLFGSMPDFAQALRDGTQRVSTALPAFAVEVTYHSRQPDLTAMRAQCKAEKILELNTLSRK